MAINFERHRYRARKLYEKHLLRRRFVDFLRPEGQQRWVAQFKRTADLQRPSVRACVLAHIYYPQLVSEILSVWGNLPAGSDLHVTCRPEIQEQVRAAIPHGPGIAIHGIENRGRDVAPCLALLNSGELDTYDAVLKIYTKRSPHTDYGSLQRRMLFKMLGGHPQQTHNILKLFERPTTGIVGWKRLFRKGPYYWHQNEARVRALFGSIGIDLSEPLQFFEGTMFWFRPSVLRLLRKLALEPADFEPEPSALDGNLHHSIERAFVFAVLVEGYQVLDTDGNLLAGPE